MNGLSADRAQPTFLEWTGFNPSRHDNESTGYLIAVLSENPQLEGPSIASMLLRSIV
jgi:hypothetical protein